MKKKKRDRGKRDIAIVLAAIVIITLGIFILKKPSITGFAVITKETAYSDDLNLRVNESGSAVWNLRNPGKLGAIKATGAISRNGSAKVYLQKDDEKILIFDSTKQLFDVNVQVLPDYKKILQGDELLIQIILFNLRGFGSADVNVRYSIKDAIGNSIAAEEENVSVETQAKFIRKLLIPTDLGPGNYVAFVEVKTPDGLIGTSSDSFEVVSKFERAYPFQLKLYIAALAAMFALLVIFILAAYGYRELKRKKDIFELKKKTPLEKMEKLEKELKALEIGYKAGFISKESHEKEKRRVEGRIDTLRKEGNKKS